MKILSIDPGFERLGIAILEKEKGNKEKLIYSECFKTKSTLEFANRLLLIQEKIDGICKNYKPEVLAIETLFMTTNQKTVIRVAEARGVVVVQSKKNGLQIKEYTPLQIKLATTGYGKSDKQSIMKMIPKIIKIDDEKHSDDELDAIAVGITCIAYEKY
jgi:crossover junction endodeoxyribonuclease RuvC